MSSISYRDWNIWVNTTLFNDIGVADGIYFLKIEPLLMAQQTVQFFYEKIEAIRKGYVSQPQNMANQYFSLNSWSPQELVLQKVSRLGPKDDFVAKIVGLLEELEALSICLDFPLTCNHIEFLVSPQHPLSGIVISATRRNITRGVSFEVSERGTAFQKVIKDYDFLLNASTEVKVASRHYINGLTLLGLEDSYAGLIDAAFMQFYQACEILCGNEYRREHAQKKLATYALLDVETTQVIMYHVWKVRNNYFGHGNTKNWLYASSSSKDVFKIAKQVLVARWLCKTLLDYVCPSNISLCREIYLYNQQSSDCFRGTIEELETTFRVDYSGRTITIYDRTGAKQKEITLQ